MTISICYVCPEGVVLGADSTASLAVPNGTDGSSYHYFNHAQKVFEIGKESSLGLITWGLASIDQSYRTLIARFADELEAKPEKKVNDVAKRWIAFFGKAYGAYIAGRTDFQALAVKTPYDPDASGEEMRTEKEEAEYTSLSQGLSVGFCIGGYCLPDRIPEAFEIQFTPNTKPTVEPVQPYKGWGAPSLMYRQIWGFDVGLPAEILKSGKWTGTNEELYKLMFGFALSPGTALPIRDAIDFVHSCIASTIKALKFSRMNQICGGPIELAVITTDRKFRWVRHKSWDAAISEGDNS